MGSTRLAALTEDEIISIHQATLRILSETGIILAHPKGRQILCEAGAQARGERLLLLVELVEGAIASCPHEVNLKGRGGSSVTLGDGSLHWHNLGGAREVYDHGSGKRRPATAQDVRDSTRLLDALEGVTTVTPFFTPCDAPGSTMSLAMYRNALPFTTKPLHGPGVQNGAEVSFALRMAEVIGPPKDLLSLSVSPVSPLTFPNEAVEAIIGIAQAGISFSPLPCPTAGTTAPLTIAGAITQQNAEALASIVLAELVHPGLPITYCGRLAMMEPRSGSSVWGGAELGLASAGTVQLAHHYGLPVNVYGFSTNSHTLEIQSGYERALNAVIPALAGADELSGVGEMEAGVMGSFAQMVCDNEIAASVRRLRRGIRVDDGTLAVDVVAAVMDGSHNFMTQKHTRDSLRAGEIMLTRLAERGSWESWEGEGRPDMAGRAQAEAERIFKEHVVPPLEEYQERELNAIMRAAESSLLG